MGVEIGPERVLIEECEFVDDELAIARDAKKARAKGDMITVAVKSINGEVQPTKMRDIIVGTDKYVKEMEKQLAEEPIKISGFAVERSFSEKYLGVMISARRSRETVISNMKYRVSECEEKLAKIRRIPRRPEVSCVPLYFVEH